MNNKQIAMKAIAEGIHLLRLLEGKYEDAGWINHSTPSKKLGDLAKSLGFRDALTVERVVIEDEERDRDAFPGDWYDWV